MASFRLDKWYFDCASPDGVLIGYAARLQWGLLRVNYGARIVKREGAPVAQRQVPQFGDILDQPDGLSWRNPALGVQGVWRGGRRLDEEKLYDGPEGAIHWHCLAANARVEASVDGVQIAGPGYAERLSMTIAPGKLPFTELRWGRYISEPGNDSAVWIDMRGEFARNWVWVNGDGPVEGRVDDSGLAVAGSEMRIDNSRSVLEENVARGILGPLGFMTPALPSRLASIEQHKRFGECTFAGPGGTSTGMAIYETVSFR